ncbi:MAG: hypothetical protein WBE37_21345 [Bryobacteraceae bacterium]
MKLMRIRVSSLVPVAASASDPNGNDMPPYSDDLKLVERFTRTSPTTIDYQLRVDDPQTYTAPWTIEFPITHEDGYRIFEYACHGGNYGLRNILSAARAEDKADAEKARAEKPGGGN